VAQFVVVDRRINTLPDRRLDSEIRLSICCAASSAPEFMLEREKEREDATSRNG